MHTKGYTNSIDVLELRGHCCDPSRRVGCANAAQFTSDDDTSDDDDTTATGSTSRI